MGALGSTSACCYRLRKKVVGEVPEPLASCLHGYDVERTERQSGKREGANPFGYLSSV